MNPLKAVAWIIGSLYLLTGGTYKAVKTYQYYHQDRSSSKFYLCRILQTGPQREALKTTYLAELMRISADRPVTFDGFDLELAQKRVLASPVIGEATVKLVDPDTVFVDYTVRQPIAWLSDFENTAFDEAGVPFPISPFFTPKKLPEVYLGIKTFAWNRSLSGPAAQIALTLLQLLHQLPLEVKRIDVSRAFLDSLGKREVVMVLDEQGFTKYLRLTPKNFAQELGNYLELRKELPPVSQIIDLRIPQLAFIEIRKSTQVSEP
jgi:hypothetical protein